jgi:hypothetical protein
MSYPQEPRSNRHQRNRSHPRQQEVEYVVVEEVPVVAEDDVRIIRQWANPAFANKYRRMQFVRKVLITVFFQLLTCSAITAAFVFSP